jgi:hypothetical protein
MVPVGFPRFIFDPVHGIFTMNHDPARFVHFPLIPVPDKPGPPGVTVPDILPKPPDEPLIIA